jgi:hypothetical protein
MGKTAVILVAVGLGGLFYYQRHHSVPPDQPEKPAASAQVAKAQSKPPSQPSEHNWMKRSLDRASDVAHQSRAQTQKSQDP